MEIIYLLVPLAVLIAIAIVVVFLWAVKSGQFEDLEGPAHRILMDEAEDAPSLALGPRLDPIGEAEDAPGQISGRGSEASRASDTARGPRLDPIGDENDRPAEPGGPPDSPGSAKKP